MNKIKFIFLIIVLFSSCEEKEHIRLVKEYAKEDEQFNDFSNTEIEDFSYAKYVSSPDGYLGKEKNDIVKKDTAADTLEETNIQLENYPSLDGSLWQITTDDSKYLIQDYGTRPAPRNVMVTNLETGKTVFSGNYYEDINLQGNTIEIIKSYGEYYAGKWAINNNLNNDEINFAICFMENNEPPKELVESADLAQGNGFGLLIIIEYDFVKSISKMIGGRYVRTM